MSPPSVERLDRPRRAERRSGADRRADAHRRPGRRHRRRRAPGRSTAPTTARPPTHRSPPASAATGRGRADRPAADRPAADQHRQAPVGVLHQASAYASPEEATQAFVVAAKTLGSCPVAGSYIAAGQSVTGVGDQATGVVVNIGQRHRDPGAQRGAQPDRPGGRTSSTPSGPARRSRRTGWPRPLAAVVATQCAAAGGSCGGTATSRTDRRRSAATSPASWPSATCRRPVKTALWAADAVEQPEADFLGSGCEVVHWDTLDAESKTARTYLYTDSGDAFFGVNEIVLTMKDERRRDQAGQEDQRLRRRLQEAQADRDDRRPGKVSGAGAAEQRDHRLGLHRHPEVDQGRRRSTGSASSPPAPRSSTPSPTPRVTSTSPTPSGRPSPSAPASAPPRSTDPPRTLRADVPVGRSTAADPGESPRTILPGTVVLHVRDMTNAGPPRGGPAVQVCSVVWRTTPHAPRSGSPSLAARDFRVCDGKRTPGADANDPAAVAHRWRSGFPGPYASERAVVLSRVSGSHDLPHQLAVSLGVLPTLTPAASSASCLAAAVPEEPETMAPAWPMVLPSGAVKPAT